MTDLSNKTVLITGARARAIRFALEQPADVNVSEIIVRPTASNVI
jgi:hypothetical protein